MVKKIIGYLLIASPWIALIVYGFATDRHDMAIILTVTLSILAVVGLGIYLVTKD